MIADEKIKNSSELEFVVFCIENVAAKLGVDAERVYQAFTEQSDILNGYIVPEYEVCYPQLVGTIQLSGGRRHVKKYMEFLKNLPGAGSGQPVTCSTSGMGLRLK